MRKDKYFTVFFTLVIVSFVSWIVFLFSEKAPERLLSKLSGNTEQILGFMSGAAPSPQQVKQTFGTIGETGTSGLSKNLVVDSSSDSIQNEKFIPPSLQPLSSMSSPKTSQSPDDISVSFVNTPGNLMEGNFATFTWFVDGPPMTIYTTTVYYGTVSTSGALNTDVLPLNTKYTQSVSDFLNGQYGIPLQFIGNAKMVTPGTYFARAYAYVNGKNYWSDERVFAVAPVPKNEIRVVDYPTRIEKDAVATFTWEIRGPTVTTGYSVIVGGKVSNPGTLDESTEISSTSYNLIFVADFTSGIYTIPIRFIGNGLFSDTGTYYFRAFTWIKGKNIWSDEHSFIVQ